MPGKLANDPEMSDSAVGFDLDQLVGTDSLSKVSRSMHVAPNKFSVTFPFYGTC